MTSRKWIMTNHRWSSIFCCHYRSTYWFIKYKPLETVASHLHVVQFVSREYQLLEILFCQFMRQQSKTRARVRGILKWFCLNTSILSQRLQFQVVKNISTLSINYRMLEKQYSITYDSHVDLCSTWHFQIIFLKIRKAKIKIKNTKLWTKSERVILTFFVGIFSYLT